MIQSADFDFCAGLKKILEIGEWLLCVLPLERELWCLKTEESSCRQGEYIVLHSHASVRSHNPSGNITSSHQLKISRMIDRDDK